MATAIKMKNATMIMRFSGTAQTLDPSLKNTYFIKTKRFFICYWFFWFRWFHITMT